MAVYTDISEVEVADFLKDYEIGELLSYKGIAEGVENSNFLIHATTAPYILTLYEKRVNPDDLPFFLGLMQHLNARGVTCPEPVQQTSGQTIGRLAGRPAAIITFLEGMWMRRPTVEHCREVGRVLAQMHIAGADFPMQRKNSLTVDGWRPLWERAKPDADKVQAGLADEVEADLAVLEAKWPRGAFGLNLAGERVELPAGAIHADLFNDNVFFLGPKLSGLIDFYFACTDLLAYDVATCLNAWCFEKDGAFNATKGAAMLEAYNAVRPLNRAEVEALPLLAQGSAIRFMLTRLYDWVNTPEGSLVVKKDPLEYLRKMRFHRQVKSAAEYGLKGQGV